MKSQRAIDLSGGNRKTKSFFEVSWKKEIQQKQTDRNEVDLFTEKTHSTEGGPSQMVRTGPGCGVVRL